MLACPAHLLKSSAVALEEREKRGQPQRLKNFLPAPPCRRRPPALLPLGPPDLSPGPAADAVRTAEATVIRPRTTAQRRRRPGVRGGCRRHACPAAGRRWRGARPVLSCPRGALGGEVSWWSWRRPAAAAGNPWVVVAAASRESDTAPGLLPVIPPPAAPSRWRWCGLRP